MTKLLLLSGCFRCVFVVPWWCVSCCTHSLSGLSHFLGWLTLCTLAFTGIYWSNIKPKYLMTQNNKRSSCLHCLCWGPAGQCGALAALVHVAVFLVSESRVPGIYSCGKRQRLVASPISVSEHFFLGTMYVVLALLALTRASCVVSSVVLQGGPESHMAKDRTFSTSWRRCLTIFWLFQMVKLVYMYRFILRYSTFFFLIK